MKNNTEAELIRELLGLYAKYGRDKFRRAIAAVKSGHATKDIIALAVLTENAISSQGKETLGKETPPEPEFARKSTSRMERLAPFLSELRAGDPGMVEIAEFVEDIAKGLIVTQGAALSNFARTIGIEVSRSKIDRVAVAQRIGHFLVRSTEIERRDIISTWRRPTTKSSLQGWTDIIVKGGKQ